MQAAQLTGLETRSTPRAPYGIPYIAIRQLQSLNRIWLPRDPSAHLHPYAKEYGGICLPKLAELLQ